MKVAVVVPVTRTDDARALAACLVRSSIGTECEIVFVAERGIPGLPGQVQCVETNERHASVRRNLGVKATTAQWIVFLDDDTLPLDGWFQELEKALEGSDPIVTGPTVPMGSTFGERVSDRVTTSPLGEGSLLNTSRQGSEPSFSSIYLCNCLVRRDVWERVGGFNEVADWRVDDTEFFFIALGLGFRAVYRKGFTVRHRRRDFFQGFLKHQFRARFATGMNLVLFPEIFLRIPGVLVMLAGLGAVPAVLLIPGLFKVFLLLYALALTADLLQGLIRHGPVALVMPLVHPAHHLVIASGFTLGLVTTILARGRHRETTALKRERYRVLQ